MADNKPTSANTILNSGAAQAAPSDTAKQYDTLPKLIPHLDRHLVFPILEFIEQQEDTDPAEALKLKYELLKETNMSDYVGELEMQIKGVEERPEEWQRKREEVIERRQLLEEQTAKLTGLLDDPEVTSNLRSDKVANLNYLKETHEVTNEEVSMLYDFGQFLYSVGDYAGASDTLFQFRLLVRVASSNRELTPGNLPRRQLTNVIFSPQTMTK